MTAGVALSCEGVSKSFEILDEKNTWRIVFGRATTIARFDALHGVTLNVPKGKFVGVIGRNGAGKSTLLRTLGGVYAPDTGDITVNGDLSGLYELGLSGNRDLTGREYAQRLLRILGLRGQTVNRVTEEVLEFSELGDRFDDALYTYSTGMSARLFFSTATAVQHDVYLIDEVLSVGDEHFQQKCWRRIRERLAGGASGVLVTHDWSTVLKVCETANVLDQGRVVLSGPADEVVRGYLDVASLVPSARDTARFTGQLPERIVWECGGMAKIAVDLEILKDGIPVHFCYAVERMSIGSGWEIIINGIDIPVGNARGRYRLEAVLPALPLAPSTYQLSIDLVAVNPSHRLDRSVLDGRGWLKGTPIVVEVRGEHGPSQVRLPLDWDLSG